ncbi:MAG: PDZ domain-containing protein [Gemmatimonadales bacterium]|nr:MAG: PDZ domain-containing protein [Gemmatimonadales bacterium]
MFMMDPLSSKIRVLLSAVVLGLAGLGGASLLGWTPAAIVAGPVFSEQPQVSEEAVRPARDLSNAFVNISQAVTPAVVRIEVERPGRTAQTGPAPGGNPFEWFFGPPGGGGQEQRQNPQAPPRTSGGSGFIVTQDGYILTNDHVVSEAQTIRVFLADGREYLAEMVGSDPTTDVAVIRIEERNLPVLSLGESRSLQVGEWVLAVGNPGFGGGRALDYTVTAGIVSAIGRPLQLLQQGLMRQEDLQEIAGFAIEDFIQTDAVINPGNSGGPLVDVDGRVIGINTAIASRTGFYQGYGFAVPIDLARRSMEDLIEYGRVRRPLLGIEMEEITNVDVEYYGLPRRMGVLVQGLPDGSPAARAGVQLEDVIVAINGDEVERPGQLQLLIAQRRPGEEVEVRLFRNGEPRTLNIRLGEADLGPRPQRTQARTSHTQERLGLDVRELTEEVASELDYPEAGGVIISSVSPAGPAARRGVSPGWRLDEINRETVTSVGDVDRILESVEPGDVVNLRLSSPTGASRAVNLRVPN